MLWSTFIHFPPIIVAFLNAKLARKLAHEIPQVHSITSTQVYALPPEKAEKTHAW